MNTPGACAGLAAVNCTQPRCGVGTVGGSQESEIHGQDLVLSWQWEARREG